MFDQDKWREIFDSMRKHKLRTFLTALSVWWGIFMLVLLLGSGNGLQNSFEHNFRDDAINSIWIYRGETSEPYKGLPIGRRIRFSNEDYQLIRNEVEDVEYITGRFYLGGEYVVKYRDLTVSYDVRCVHPDHQFLENTLIVEGRFLNPRDIEQYRKVCVIGEMVAEELFREGEDPIGKYINVKDTEYQVVGIFTDEGPDSERQKIYLPITTAQKIYAGEPTIHQMMITTGDIPLKQTYKVEAALREKLSERHHFAPSDEKAIYIRNTAEDYQEFLTVFSFIKGFIWFVGVGSIIAGVIGVSNIMLIVIKDRTKEFGIRKALGATPWSIISMVLMEALFLTSVAGYLGLLSGFALITGIRKFMEANEVELEFFYNPEVSFGTIVVALLVLVVSGMLAGFFPGMRAARIAPVEALRAD